MIYTYESIGEITLSESAEAASSYFSSEADGYIYIGGDSIAIESVHYVASGDINVNYSVEALHSRVVEYYFDFNFDIYASFEFGQDFYFDVGELPLRTFRVVGVEYYNCDHIPFCAIPNGLNRMFQEMAARNLSEVCQFLSDVNWTWPIADIQRSVHSIDSFISVGSTGLNINGLPIPSTNEFVSVPFSQIPECLQFTVVPTPAVAMGMSMYVDTLFYMGGSGSVGISGFANTARRFVAAGSLAIEGSADYLSSCFFYEAGGSVGLSPEYELTASDFSFDSYGVLSLYGESEVVSQRYAYATSGSLVFSGDAVSLLKLRHLSSGAIVFGGGSEYPMLHQANGTILVSGSSLASKKSYAYAVEGMVSVSGQSSAFSPYYGYEPSGSAMVEGSIVVSKASFRIDPDFSFPISVSGLALERDSINGEFWYVPLISDLLVGDSAESSVKGVSYKSFGNIVVSGNMDTSIYQDEVAMGSLCEIDFIEMVYNEDFVSNLVSIVGTVNTTCGSCDAIPQELYLSHNLKYSVVFKDFLLRNGFSIDDSIKFTYSPKSDSWRASLHYIGSGADINDLTEIWQINMDWSCVSTFGEDQIGSSLWKFGIYVNRKSLATDVDYDTRLVSFFPSDEICAEASRKGLDFSFGFNFANSYVTNSLGIVIDNFTIYDNIGMFKGSYWRANDFSCRITAVDLIADLIVNDLTYIKPLPPTQFYV